MKFFLFWISFSAISLSQTLTFKEFIDLSGDILDTSKASKIISYFPERFQITALDYGDISGDDISDFAIAVDPLGNRGHEVFIFIFCAYPDEYKIIYRDTLKYVITPLEIGFSISKNACFITHKAYELSWTIKGFSFFNNEYSEVDVYETDTLKLKKNSYIGVENYLNYQTLSSFKGYYDLNDLKEKHKYEFITIPVYDFRRNIYKKYPKKFRLNQFLKFSSDTASNYRIFDFGSFETAKDGQYLRIQARIDTLIAFTGRPDKSLSIKAFFDLNGSDLIYNVKKKAKLFRDSLDDNVFGVEVLFAGDEIVKTNFYNKEIFPQAEIRKIKITKNKAEALELELSIPLSMLKYDGEAQDTVRSFISFEFFRNDETIALKNTAGSYNNPVSYGKLIFIEKDKNFGVLSNYRFSELIKKLKLNGAAVQSE